MLQPWRHSWADLVRTSVRPCAFPCAELVRATHIHREIVTHTHIHIHPQHCKHTIYIYIYMFMFMHKDAGCVVDPVCLACSRAGLTVTRKVLRGYLFATSSMHGLCTSMILLCIICYTWAWSSWGVSLEGMSLVSRSMGRWASWVGERVGLGHGVCSLLYLT